MVCCASRCSTERSTLLTLSRLDAERVTLTRTSARLKALIDDRWRLVADRAYDARRLTDELRARGCTVVIPSTRARAIQHDIDRHLYRERALVENFFQRMKRLRRIAMRYEKLARNYLAFLQLAAVLVWLR